ncbi:YsnF/AvaK domain-containing protein [Oceanobacillus rekensis]|uniref:YsnF/AvaK domain-containing protein n=1 Tax=Oceanobacillus rekensis TaxID=937927 RepID=UPI000B43A6A2|nr:YsnF/AvaK domain-containing protein [Oceanobacillus rekensis]
MAKHIIGTYNTEIEAIAAVKDFKANGMLAEDLTVLTNRKTNTESLENNTNVNVENGGTTGDDDSFWESVKKLFSGEDDATNNHPHEQLTNLGISSSEANTYKDDLAADKIILISESGMGVGADADLDTNAIGTAPFIGSGSELDPEIEKVKRREEELQINKNKVQTGEVQVDKTVSEEFKDVEVPVEKDEVHVERRPVLDYEESTRPIEDDESIRVPIVEEEIEVKKKPVVKEEVVIDKSKNLDTEHVADTVKKEHVDVTENGIDVEDPLGKGVNKRNDLNK